MPFHQSYRLLSLARQVQGLRVRHVYEKRKVRLDRPPKLRIHIAQVDGEEGFLVGLVLMTEQPVQLTKPAGHIVVVSLDQ